MKMIRNHFRHLPPSIDLNIVGDAVRKCVEILKRHKINIKELSEMIAEDSNNEIILNENTLKAFIQRSELGRTNRSDTLEALFNFFYENWHLFDNSIRAEMAGVWENFQPDLNNNGETKKFFKNTMEHIFGGLLLNWVGSSADQITKYKDELCDDYYLLRKSVRAPEAIVRSECKIEWTSPKDLKVTHWHHDRYDEIRTSKGFMVPTDGNHIAVLNIENGLSIEFLAVKKPPTERFKRLIGFIVTINSNGVLISARVSLIKKRELSFEPPIRFRFDAYDEDVVMKKTIKFLSSDEAMTIPDWTSQLYSEIEKDDGKKGK